MSEYMKLEPAVKELWIAALLDPSRSQTKRYLRTKEGFCCLGILCDIMDSKGWSSDGDRGFIFEGAGRFLVPDELRERIYLDYAAQNFLSNANDNGWTFKEIAEWIGENL
jgi:hypothetical protein